MATKDPQSTYSPSETRGQRLRRLKHQLAVGEGVWDRDRPPSEDEIEDVRSDIHRQVNDQLSRESWTPYASIASVVATVATSNSRSLAISLIDAKRRIAAATEREALKESMNGVLITVLGVLGILLIFVIVGSSLASWSTLPDHLFELALGLGELVLVGVGIWWLLRDERRAESMIQELNAIAGEGGVAKTEYTEALEDGVRKALNVSLSMALVSATDVPALIGSRRLIESRRAQVIESRAIAELETVIDSHDTSAIGIAGERGIGKSTLLRHLAERTRAAGGLAVEIAVPVVYQPEDLVRRVFEEFLLAAQSHDARTNRSVRPAWQSWTRRKTVTVLGGLATIAAGLTALLVDPPAAQWLAQSRANIAAEPTRVIGALLVAIGGALTVWASMRYPSTLRPSSRWNPQASYSIAEGVDALHWTREWTSTSEAGFELPSSVFKSRIGSSMRHVERPSGRPDLTLRFRRTLERYLRECRAKGQHSVRVVICVDELDKLEYASSLHLVNELKDLMHVEGSHFLLSVSDEAMDLFALRGVAVREAVDSAFDEVVALPDLTVSESHILIVSRAPEFPPPLTRFCHAWSMGNPRELLRTARHCLVSGGNSPEARLQLGEIVTKVVDMDVQDAVLAQMNRMNCRSETSGKGLDRHWNQLMSGNLEQIRGIAREFAATEGICNSRQWGALADYLGFAIDVKSSFGEALPYGEWLRRSIETRELDELATRLSSRGRRRRATWQGLFTVGERE